MKRHLFATLVGILLVLISISGCSDGNSPNSGNGGGGGDGNCGGGTVNVVPTQELTQQGGIDIVGSGFQPNGAYHVNFDTFPNVPVFQSTSTHLIGTVPAQLSTDTTKMDVYFGNCKMASIPVHVKASP